MRHTAVRTSAHLSSPRRSSAARSSATFICVAYIFAVKAGAILMRHVITSAQLGDLHVRRIGRRRAEQPLLLVAVVAAAVGGEELVAQLL